MSHRRSIVEQIVGKISFEERRGFDVTRELNEKTNEQLRLLETKISTGMLGKGDTPESRAAAILEYLVRQGSIHRFSLESLADALGMKKKSFQTIHQKVANYLPSLSGPMAHTTSGSTKRKAAGTTTTTIPTGKSTRTLQNSTASTGAAANATSDTVEISSSIPSISIRLGSLVHDSHGFATRAEQLLRDIEGFMNTKNCYSNPHLRREALNDLQRHRGVYEAACFYVVATQATTNTKKGRNSSSQSLEDGMMAADEGQLEEKDVIHASNVSEQAFKDILPTVVELAAKVARNKKDPPKIRKRTNKARAKGSSRDRGKSKQVEEPRHVYSDAFEEWREELLSNTSHDAKQVLSKELSTPIEDISESQAMERAADDVLRRHGLLTDL